ncbi:c-type cytochrome biogenesis protein CcmI [Reinekea marinisedimentorum]|uniref:Cytochrome c-type biogenesis protein CcmI n=1 Tax=Reinekea marinisedimentorum TaxID=230495 RepID=A0A4R3I814_9GAMM|nr:c-type cytochrome biogenesis protein CcmI [Reinekea marinisedimentorum]TCS41425.1 cytochrome c-type biogenesis protein CcmI [Reinekea marinisedimentorum]
MLVLSLWAIPALIFVIYVVRLRPAKTAAEDSVTRSISIHRERLADLEAQLAAGSLTEAEYKSFRLEEEKALLADTGHQQAMTRGDSRLPWFWAPLLMVFVFALASFTYSKIGAEKAVNVQQQFQQISAGEEIQPEALDQALNDYQTLLESQPENIEGWFQLARMQMDLQQYEAAYNSFAQVLSELRKVDHNADDEATILAYMGQIEFSLGKLEQSLALFEESLQFGKSNTALGLAGRVAYELAQYEKSIDYWTQLKNANPNSDTQIIDGFIEQSISALKEQGIVYDPGTQVTVQISLPAAWQGLTSDAILFVYARPVGQRMPLVAKRLPVTGQQMTVVLSERDSMSGAGFEGLDEVEVTARVSLTGVANQQPGDWLGDVAIAALSESESSVSVSIAQP